VCTDVKPRVFRYQRGLASIELAFILPILLFFMILYMHAGMSMQLKEHTVIKTRTAGWNYILNGNCDAALTIEDKLRSFLPSLTEQMGCKERDGEAVLEESELFWVALQDAANDSAIGGFLRNLGGALEFADLKSLTEDVRKDGDSGSDKGVSDVVVTAQSSYRRGRLDFLGSQTINETYSLHGGSYWHSQDFEDSHGYDARLKKEIEDPFGKLEDLFPNLFPYE